RPAGERDHHGRCAGQDLLVRHAAAGPRRAGRTAAEDRGHAAAARGAHPQRRARRLRAGGPRGARRAAGRRSAPRLPHRTAGALMHVRAGAEPDPDPMVDINTTPLVDVLLVLLVMLIVTIPVQLHAVSLEMPGRSAPTPPEPPVIVQ